MSLQADHEHWMRLALAEARKAADVGEVPVGAVLVHDGELLASAHNAPLTSHDPSAHAEIRALRAAGARVQNYRLPETTLYVTIEPCPMCVGALTHARVQRIVFGAREPRAGALVSRESPLDKPWLNHHPQVIEGVLGSECAELMRSFFAARRGGSRSQQTN